MKDHVQIANSISEHQLRNRHSFPNDPWHHPFNYLSLLLVWSLLLPLPLIPSVHRSIPVSLKPYDSGHGFMETWMSMWEKISPLFFFIKAELFPGCSPPHTCLETVTFYLKGGLEIISALHGIHRLGKWHHPETIFLLLKLPSIYANSQTWCYSYSWYFIIFVSFENTCSPETSIFLVLFIHVQNCSHICIYPTANW